MDPVRRVKSIITKELVEAFRNKTFLIVFLLPLIASLFFSIINNAEMEKNFRVGIIEEENQGFFKFVSTNIKNFKPYSYQNVEEGNAALRQGSIDGLIVLHNKQNFTIYIDSQKAMTFLFLRSSIEELIELYLGIEPEVIKEVIPVNISKAHWSFLPIWITITITMIGVLVLSGSLAEEKESKTLDALLVTPVNKSDILLGKSGAGIILIFLTVTTMFLVNGVILEGFLQYITLCVMILAAALCFSALGLLIGNLAGSQSTARSLGTIVYFPLLFPALIYDLTAFTRKLARLFPTYHLMIGLEKLLLYKDGFLAVWKNIAILLFFCLIFIAINFIYLKGMKAK
jgi:ABC-2 type transport system permease protein